MKFLIVKRAYHRVLLKFQLILVAVAWAQDAEVGSRACAGCHAEIFAKYQQTGMARSAGPVGAAGFQESFAHAEFTDPASGADYRISPSYQFNFARAGIEGPVIEVVYWIRRGGAQLLIRGRWILVSSAGVLLLGGPEVGRVAGLSAQANRRTDSRGGDSMLAVPYQPHADGDGGAESLRRAAIPRRRSKLRAMPWRGAGACFEDGGESADGWLRNGESGEA